VLLSSWSIISLRLTSVACGGGIQSSDVAGGRAFRWLGVLLTWAEAEASRALTWAVGGDGWGTAEVSLSFLERSLYSLWAPHKCSISMLTSYSHRIRPIYCAVYVLLYVITQCICSCLGCQKRPFLCKQGEENSCTGWSFELSLRQECQPCS